MTETTNESTCNAPHPKYRLRCERKEHHPGKHHAHWQDRKITWARNSDGLDSMRGMLP